MPNKTLLHPGRGRTSPPFLNFTDAFYEDMVKLSVFVLDTKGLIW